MGDTTNSSWDKNPVLTHSREDVALPSGYYPTSPYVVNALPIIRKPLTFPVDTLVHPLNLLEPDFGRIRLEVTVDKVWSHITFTEFVDGSLYRIPFTAPVDWYFSKMLSLKRMLQFHAVLTEQEKDDQRRPTTRGRGKAIEVVGVDVGDLGRVSLRVRGNVNLSGKMVFQDQELVRSNINETQNTHIEFDQKQNLNIEGKIGDKITVSMDQDSERDFDWENNIRITYDGEEDDIIQRVEAGNIGLSLPSTQFVTFSGQNKGLFGLKSIAKLGPVDVTAIASIEQTRKEKLEYKGGSQASTQEIRDYNYVKNRYFFVNEWFRNGVDTSIIVGTNVNFIRIPPFYPLKDGLHLIGDVVVKDFELYKLDLTNNPGADVGIAYIDPSNPDLYPDDNEQGNFIWLERDVQYSVSEDLGFIRLREPVLNEILGCTYILMNRSSGDTILTVGRDISEQDSLLVLQMLKPRSPHPNHPTWDLMFKNVYYLGTTGINKEGFGIQIINRLITPQSNRDPQGTSYITQFGLDSLNESGARQADEIIDMDSPNIINMITGELMFPALHPFVHADSLEGGNRNPALQGALGEGTMYTSTIPQDITGDHRFIIEAKYTNQSSTINLGFMLVEGSEEIRSDGRLLERGLDYQIDYFSGTIVLLSEIATDPNAQVSVRYDKHELVSFDKKTIVGTRAQMDLGENSFLGVTALFYNQSIINQKIEVGYEPIRNFIWDMNGRVEKDLDGLTRMLDKLPLIDTDKMSTLTIEGEFAQVLPNPNPINNPTTGDPRGLAYIDDFEGSKRTTSPPIQRRFWLDSSAPLDLWNEREYSQRNRARLIWYNPYGQIRTTDIWPNQSVSTLAQNETTDILVLKYAPRSHQMGTSPDSVWAGLTTALYSGDYDQTQSKFFEIWLRGGAGKLTVDLGKISEDRNGNGVLDTEDVPEAGLTLGNGFLEDEEDTGLDGCFDEYEDGWGGCLPDTVTYLELLNAGEVARINANIVDQGGDVDPQDPNGDNWSYTEGSSNYNYVNGTENNGTGTRIQEGGKYPDTEDLDRSDFLDKINDFFSITFALDDTTYLGGETEKDGQPTGWRLFRVPLSHFQQVRDVEWNEIRYLRLTVSGIEEPGWMQIARMELVGNEWQELGIAAPEAQDFTLQNADSIFAITVFNTEDNSDYQPPKGVKGEYDRINEIQAKEQSLVMKFSELPSRYRAAAVKNLIVLRGDRAKSYLTYGFMKMYVYGDSPWILSNETSVEFFMRFGLGENYYEITQPVYKGWDENNGRNAVKLDLAWLTRLKVQDSTSVKKIRETDVFRDSADVRSYLYTDEEGNFTGKRIEIFGKPALSRIQYFIVGVRNLADEPISGQVWLDELRLSGVKKDAGVALRVQSKLRLADLGGATLLYSRKDADFHVLQRRLGSNLTASTISVGTNLALHRLFPKSWGLSFPLNVSYANRLDRPKYFPDTDVLVVGDAAPDSILTKSQSINLSSSLSKSSKSDRKLVKYTLDNLKGSFSASRAVSSNVIMSEVRNESYRGKLSYFIPFGRDNYVQPLKWLKGIPWLGEKMSELSFYYSPSTVNTGIDFNEKLVRKMARVGARSPDDYNFGLNRNMSLDYRITDNLTTKYAWGARSKLNAYRGYVWTAIRDLDPGIVEASSENLSTSFTPKLFSWFRPNFNYSANYRWDHSVTSTYEGAVIGTTLRFSSSVALNPTTLFELFYKPPSRSPTAPRSGRRRRGKPAAEELQDKKPEKTVKEKPFLTTLHGIVKKVNPFNISYTENLNRNGISVLGTVPAGYKFGWLPEHGLEHSQDAYTNTGDWNQKRDFSIRSGIKFSRNITTTYTYTQNLSTSISGTGVEQRATSRDYFAYGEKLRKGFPFVGWSLRLGGLEKWPFLKKYFRSVSLEHNYSGKESRRWQFEDLDAPKLRFIGLATFVEDFQEYERSSRINSSYSPLIGLNMSLKKGVSLTLRHNRSRSVDELPTGLTIRDDQTYTANANYTHRGGFTIPLPFMEDFKIQNTMNFTLNFDLNESETQGTKNKLELTQQAYNFGWKTSLRVSYSFTSRVSGGLIYEYRESETKTSGKRIDRDFGFDVNIAISG